MTKISNYNLITSKYGIKAINDQIPKMDTEIICFQ